MIDVRPFESLAASAVLQRLDVHDLIEAEVVRGTALLGLDLWADWRAMQGMCIASHVFTVEGQAFAVGAIVATGQSGVAQAALLARDHRRFRRPLVELARRIRDELPGFCADRGIHRVEARCWAGHPSASRFLAGIGFAHETDLFGFGADGRAVLRQFAWLQPQLVIPRCLAPHQPERTPACV